MVFWISRECIFLRNILPEWVYYLMIRGRPEVVNVCFAQVRWAALGRQPPDIMKSCGSAFSLSRPLMLGRWPCYRRQTQHRQRHSRLPRGVFRAARDDLFGEIDVNEPRAVVGALEAGHGRHPVCICCIIAMACPWAKQKQELQRLVAGQPRLSRDYVRSGGCVRPGHRWRRLGGRRGPFTA